MGKKTQEGSETLEARWVQRDKSSNKSLFPDEKHKSSFGDNQAF